MAFKKIDMKNKFWIYLKEIIWNFVSKVLVFDLLLIGLILLSFLFTKNFSVTALSDRLVWAGIGVMLIGGILALGQTAGGRNFGTPIMTSAQASLLTDWNIEIRQDVVKKFSPIIRLFMIGLVCFCVGVLVQVFFA